MKDKIKIVEKRTDVKYVLTVELSLEDIERIRNTMLAPGCPSILNEIVAHVRELTSEGFFEQ